MPITTGRLPVWLSHADRLLARAREHRASFEATGRDAHLERATTDFRRASLAYLHGVLGEERTSLPPLAGEFQKDAEASVDALHGPFRAHAQAAMRTAQAAVINPGARHASLHFAGTLAEQLRAGLPESPPESGGGRGIDRDRSSARERSR